MLVFCWAPTPVSVGFWKPSNGFLESRQRVIDGMRYTTWKKTLHPLSNMFVVPLKWQMACTLHSVLGLQPHLRPCSSATSPSDHHQAMWMKCLAQRHNNRGGQSGNRASNPQTNSYSNSYSYDEATGSVVVRADEPGIPQCPTGFGVRKSHSSGRNTQLWFTFTDLSPEKPCACPDGVREGKRGGNMWQFLSELCYHSMATLRSAVASSAA